MVTLDEVIRDADAVLALATIGILLYLLVTYVVLYRMMRQKFTLGLIVFALLLLMTQVSGALFILRGRFFEGDQPPPPGSHPPGGEQTEFVFIRFIPTFLTFIGCVVLAWLTRE